MTLTLFGTRSHNGQVVSWPKARGTSTHTAHTPMRPPPQENLCTLHLTVHKQTGRGRGSKLHKEFIRWRNYEGTLGIGQFMYSYLALGSHATVAFSDYSLAISSLISSPSHLSSPHPPLSHPSFGKNSALPSCPSDRNLWNLKNVTQVKEASVLSSFPAPQLKTIVAWVSLALEREVWVS